MPGTLMQLALMQVALCLLLYAICFMALCPQLYKSDCVSKGHKLNGSLVNWHFLNNSSNETYW